MIAHPLHPLHNSVMASNAITQIKQLLTKESVLENEFIVTTAHDTPDQEMPF